MSQQQRALSAPAVPPGPRGVASDPAADALRREARYLHRVLFASMPLPPEVETHYVAAHAHVFARPSTSLQVDVGQLLERRLDAEAIELVLRRRSPRNVLTQKLQILAYLAEARPEYYARFIQEEPRPVWAFVRLTLAVVRTAWKLLKGSYLVRKHHVL